MTCADSHRWLVRAFLLGSIVTAAVPALADDNHYQDYIVGERAVGLGGAFTAISDDASGAYYNPAGLAETPFSSVSLSAALYGFGGDWIDLPSSGEELSQSTFISYPTTAAWIQLLRKGNAETGAGRMQFALSMVTPQNNVRRKRLFYSGQGNQPTDVVEVMDIEAAEDDTLWVGLSYAWKVHRRIALGATLFTTIRTGVYQFYEIDLLRRTNGQQEIDRRAFSFRDKGSIEHVGILGVVGLVVGLSDFWRLGLSFRTPMAQVHSRLRLNSISVGEDQAGTGFTVSSQDIDASFNDRQPFKATMGLAYVKPRNWGAALDFSIYGPQSQYSMITDSGLPALEQMLQMKKRLVWQLNVGAEYYLWDGLPVRGGFFTNLSSLAQCDGSDPDCNEVFADPVDRFGFAGSIGYEIDRATLTLGWSYCVGSKDISEENVNYTVGRSFLFFMLGGSFRF